MAKKLAHMRYKDFKFPYNPSDCKYTCDRSFVKHKYPQLKGSELEDFGPNAVVISGSGEFFGRYAYTNWKRLTKEFKKLGVGTFSHPIYTDVTRALMTKCESELEPRENYVKYSFEFVADATPIVKKAKRTTSSNSDGSDGSDSSNTSGFNVGDIVYVNGRLWYDSYGSSPHSRVFVNERMTITKIVLDPKTGQDWYIHCGTIGWGKPSQMTKVRISTTTDSTLTVITTHIVKKGECLSKICVRYGADWHIVAKYNKMKNPHLIYPGDKIIIVK